MVRSRSLRDKSAKIDVFSFFLGGIPFFFFFQKNQYYPFIFLFSLLHDLIFETDYWEVQDNLTSLFKNAFKNLWILWTISGIHKNTIWIFYSKNDSLRLYLGTYWPEILYLTIWQFDDVVVSWDVISLLHSTISWHFNLHTQFLSKYFWKTLLGQYLNDYFQKGWWLKNSLYQLWSYYYFHQSNLTWG